MNYYIYGLKNYFTFSGRARRKEFWMFTLFNVIFAIVAMIIDRLLGTTLKMDLGMGPQSLGYGYVYLAYGLAVLIPGLAVQVRRLHDVGKADGSCLLFLFRL
jgi:uncharacterized membrane protein YhaH (DUF805 family)